MKHRIRINGFGGYSNPKMKTLKYFAAGVLCALFAWATYVVCMWTDNNLEWALSHIKGQPVDVPNWISVLVTLVGNGAIIIANIICEIIKAYAM